MKTKYQLIKLEDYNIIVSDEEIKDRDWFYNIKSQNIFYNDSDKSIPKGETEFPLIASDSPEHKLPSIDYNGLEEELGIVDVEKLSKVDIKFHHKNIQAREIDYVLGYEDGFKKAQELNDKKFSLEDMFKCFQAGIDYEKEGGILQPDAHGYIQSLQQPKVIDIEVEVEEIHQYEKNPEFYGTLHENTKLPSVFKPKITNNKIKITKILS